MLKLSKISIGVGIAVLGLGSISLLIYALGESEDMLRWGLALTVVGLGGVLLGIGVASRWQARSVTSLANSVSSLRSLTERVATKEDTTGLGRGLSDMKEELSGVSREGETVTSLHDLDVRLGEVTQDLDEIVEGFKRSNSQAETLRSEARGQSLQVEALLSDVKGLTGDHARLLSQIDAILRPVDSLLATSLRAERESDARDRMAINQVSALLYLHAALKPAHPLPSLGDWALAADACAFIVGRVLNRRPETVLELGSGSSTVLLALATERTEGGRIVSIDHDPVYLEKTRTALKDRGLAHRVELVLAPLEEIEIEDVRSLWYGIPTGALPEAIDLVIVDGPPMAEGSSRFPALPVLGPRLTLNGALVLDDANREKEAHVIAKWRDAHPDLSFSMLGDHQKGVAVFERSHVPR